MTSYDAHDASADSLDQLMALAPDPNRAVRVRARCRTQLSRSQRRAARTALITEFGWRVLAPVVVGTVGVFYAVVLVATTLRLQGIFH
jgi:hypothetical protein